MDLYRYLEQLQEAIRANHECFATYQGTGFVDIEQDGATKFHGAVEIFELVGHPHASRCYAWGWEEDGGFQAKAVLHLPPIISPTLAVQHALSASSGSETGGGK